MRGELWCYEVILLPSRVIERSYVDAEAVTRDLAKSMFAEWYARGDYPSAARYTADDYRRKRSLFCKGLLVPRRKHRRFPRAINGNTFHVGLGDYCLPKPSQTVAECVSLQDDFDYRRRTLRRPHKHAFTDRECRRLRLFIFFHGAMLRLCLAGVYAGLHSDSRQPVAGG